MKTQTFQMRISEETKEELTNLANYYKTSAASVVCMLIAKEANSIKK